LGFEPAEVVRITPRAQGGAVTVLKVVEPLTKADTESSWEVDDPFAISVPFSQLGKDAVDAFELALIVSREGKDIEVVPPSGALGVRVPGVAAIVEAERAQPLKVLVATSELAPFAKLGGVSDVAAALSKELHRLGHDVGVVLPRNRQVDLGGHGLAPAVQTRP